MSGGRLTAHDLALAAPDGANPRRLTDGPVQQLSFSGDRLVFVRGRQMYTMPRGGGMALPMAPTGSGRTGSVPTGPAG